jgi:hypothetical protein
MGVERLYFSTIKESREDFFVEYRPPVDGYRFATLQLTYIENVDRGEVASAMESEARAWHKRFPIPLMVSAFDSEGELINLDGVRAENHLIVLLNQGEQSLQYHWRLLNSEEIPSDALNRDLLLAVYADVGRKTSSELRTEARDYARKIRIGWYMVFLWTAVLPLAFLVLEFLGPDWLAAAVFIYALFKAVENALKMLGKWKKSPAEISREEEERRMRHHHYHCERNPEAFARLKFENLQREEGESIRQESESLKKGGS